MNHIFFINPVIWEIRSTLASTILQYIIYFSDQIINTCTICIQIKTEEPPSPPISELCYFKLTQTTALLFKEKHTNFFFSSRTPFPLRGSATKKNTLFLCFFPSKLYIFVSRLFSLASKLNYPHVCLNLAGVNTIIRLNVGLGNN